VLVGDGLFVLHQVYRSLQPTHFVNYETFRVLRASSVSIFAFASMLSEMAEDEMEFDAQEDDMTDADLDDI
jgi:hypothetical protein